MATVKDYFEFLNSIAPFDTQEDWDNSGILVGDKNALVSKVLVTLDITLNTIEQAKEIGANLIISHHPVIFRAMKCFTSGSIPFEMAANSINAICCHTPLDIAVGGTNDTLAELLGYKVYIKDNPILRFATIDSTTPKMLAEHIAHTLGTHIRYASADKTIEKIAICTGAGCSLLSECEDIDAFITGDASHHDFLDAVNDGITLIAAGHFETENPFVSTLVKKLSDKFIDNEIINAEEKNPITFI